MDFNTIKTGLEFEFIEIDKGKKNNMLNDFLLFMGKSLINILGNKSKFNDIAAIYSSIPIDIYFYQRIKPSFDVPEDAITKKFKENCENYGFGLFKTNLARNKKNGMITLLISLYVDEFNDNTIMEIFKNKSGLLLSFVYMKELFDLSQNKLKTKFFHNKFIENIIESDLEEDQKKFLIKITNHISTLGNNFHSSCILINNIEKFQSLQNNDLIFYHKDIDEKMNIKDVIADIINNCKIKFITMQELFQINNSENTPEETIEEEN